LPRLKEAKIEKRMIVLPDTHGELVDPAALNCALEAILVLKPDTVLHLGDLGEFESVNHHRWKRIKQPDPHVTAAFLRRDIRATKRLVLDPIDTACQAAGVKEKIITQGNHDVWLDNFCEVFPDYRYTTFDDVTGYTFVKAFNFEQLGWTVHPCGKLIKIGKLHFYHGHLYSGIHHAHNHLMKMGVSVVYGHHHDYQAKHVTHATGPKGAYSLGCLKRIDPLNNQWMGYRPTNWAHYFGVVDFIAGGKFFVHPVPIIFGRCSLLGYDIIDGNKGRTG
jgi:hypothetical protein